MTHIKFEKTDTDWWNEEREKLEQAVIDSVLNLFGHTGAGALKIPVRDTTPPLYVCSGTAESIKQLIED